MEATTIQRSNWTKAKSFLSSHRGSIIQYGSFLFVLVLFSALTSGEIWTPYNLKTLIGQVTPLLLLSIGMTFVFAHGGFDIASGAMVGLNSLILAEIVNATGSLVLGFLVVLLLSILVYAAECLISIKLGLIPTIASLAIMFGARGLVTYVCSLHEGVVHLNDFSIFNDIKTNWALQLSLCIVIAMVAYILFDFTKFGKGLRAIGDNELSARQSGIKSNRYKLFAYMIAGLLVGVASLFVLARSGSIGKGIGSGYEMDVMVAIILGGMALSGGSKSRLSAALVGSFTYRLLANGMTKAGVPTEWISLVRGSLFLLIIFATLRQSKNVKELPR